LAGRVERSHAIHVLPNSTTESTLIFSGFLMEAMELEVLGVQTIF
jgi:hypothetical protein